MNLKNQKVAVCGAGGFIGGHLVRSLLDQGVDVVRATDVKPLECLVLHRSHHLR